MFHKKLCPYRLCILLFLKLGVQTVDKRDDDDRLVASLVLVCSVHFEGGSTATKVPLKVSSEGGNLGPIRGDDTNILR